MKWRVEKSRKPEWRGWFAISPSGHELPFVNQPLALAYVVARINRNRRLIEVGEDLASRFRTDEIVDRLRQSGMAAWERPPGGLLVDADGRYRPVGSR